MWETINMRNASSAKILLFHGVTNSISKGIENFSKKHLPLDQFKEEIEYYSHNANPIPLRDLVKYLSNGKTIPENTVAITFDDSFKNIADCALPILRKYSIPATFFLPTGFIGTRRLFWVDKIEHAVNLTDEQKLNIKLPGFHVDFDLYSGHQRKIAVVDLKRKLKGFPPDRRDYVIERIIESTNVSDDGSTVANYQHLSWNEVPLLEDFPQFEIGGHTVNHEILSYLDDQNLTYEIKKCIDDLELNLNHKIDLFSYPEGQRQHFNDNVILKLKSLGVIICPTAIHGENNLGDDPFHLKRIRIGKPDLS